jgi:hypothetical protein
MRTAQVTMERRAARYDVIGLHAALLKRMNRAGDPLAHPAIIAIDNRSHS